jgi:hypothetical protein
MAVTKEDIFAALATMTDDEKAALAETMAPDRKLGRLLEASTALRRQAEQGLARVTNFLAAYEARVEGGDLAEPPGWDEVVKVFGEQG